MALRDAWTRNGKRFLLLLDVFATLAIVIAAAFLIRSSIALSSTTKSATTRKLPVPSDPIDTRPVASIGSQTAPVGRIVYSDFECPSCGRFARDTFPKIALEYVKRGAVRVTFHHFPLEAIHSDAVRAATAVECAGVSGRFWDMHDAIFADQKHLDRQSLTERAAVLGLQPRAFAACLDDPELHYVNADLRTAKRLGLRGTPTFHIGMRLANGAIKVSRVMVGAVTFERLAAILDEVLKNDVSGK